VEKNVKDLKYPRKDSLRTHSWITFVPWVTVHDSSRFFCMV